MIDPSLRVRCTGCDCEYLLDPKLVPAGGARVSCRRCGTRFVVQHPARAKLSTPPPPQSRVATTWPQLPPRQPTRRAWIFPDDPAMNRSGVLHALQGGLAGWTIELVDGHSRAALTQAAHERSQWPELVVFGDMQVLLEDRLLQAVATRAGVLRILVSTHLNDELIAEAQRYCGFDRHLVLPITPSAVEEALSRAAG